MNSNTRIGIYAASFDPLTDGHVHVIREASTLFDKIVVAVGTNPGKRPMFTKDERVTMIEEVFLGADKLSVIDFETEYLVDVAIREQCTHLIRGVRNTRDCEEELMMAEINRRMALSRRPYKMLSTVFIPTTPEFALISSSFVKSLIGFENWPNEVKKYVPENVAKKLVERMQG